MNEVNFQFMLWQHWAWEESLWEALRLGEPQNSSGCGDLRLLYSQENQTFAFSSWTKYYRI
jgi:hypothetical protein